MFRSPKTVLLVVTFLISFFPMLSFAATIGSPQASAPKGGLVGYWSFDGPDFTDKIYDKSGQGNHVYFDGGATTSAKIPGKIGQAMQFDGVDDEVFVGDIPTLTGATDVPFSWSWWRKSSVEGDQEISWGYYRWCAVRGWAGTDGGMVCDVSGGDAIIAGDGLHDGTWHHIVLTHDSGTQNLYIDGVLGVTENNAFAAETVNMRFGTRPSSGFYNGSLDEVRVYDRALTANEVKALYRMGTAKLAKTPTTSVKSGLVGWWTFDGKDVVGTGPTSANTGWTPDPTTASTSTPGTLAWSNINNIFTESDGLRASVTLSGTAQSHYLRASNYGFSVPANATIVGFEADIMRRRSGGTTGQARDYSVRLIDDTGTLVGSDKAFTGTNWPTTDTWVCDSACYGGPNDLWGTTLTPAQVNDPDFGWAIQVNGAAAGANRVAEIDNMEINIYYITPGGAIDKSGSGNHGTLTNGVKGTAGKIGQAMGFDGVDDRVDIDDTSSLNITGAVTVSAWVRPTDLTVPPWWRTIVTRGGVNSGTANMQYALSINPGAAPQFEVSNGAALLTTGTAPLPTNQWYHMVGTYDGSANVRFYLDGVEVSNNNSPGFGALNSSGHTQFGYSDNDPTQVFKGSLDDVRIYNRALSAAEVKSIYNEGSGVAVGKSQNTLIPNGLVGYWSFNGPDFTDKVYDRSGQNNHGYVIGAATSSVKTAGKIGQGIKLDGVDDEVNADLVSTPTDYSMSFWFKTTDIPIATLITLGQYIRCSIGYFSGGSLNCGASGDDEVETSFDANDGKWHHAVFTARQASPQQVLYFDGAVASSSNVFAGLTDGSVVIGNYFWGGRPFNGSLDEVRIYNRALTASEVKTLYNAGR